MNPDNLPSNTEYAYAHLYQPHPYLFTQTGFEMEPIRPMTRTIMKMDTPAFEPEKRRESSPPPMPKPKRRVGRPRKLRDNV